ncbi:MAG: type II secretion system major pseudopilin GspG [Planctomycetales bacterium]|nr:type II secretion system major pseudopilin GspG [Planctomycetales bacterium]
MSRHQRKGLTLVELLVVLAILVVILGLIGPRVLGSQNKADIQKTKIDIGNMSAALKTFAVDNKGFPTTEDGLNVLMERPADEQSLPNWDGPYLDAEALPRDPWGNEYRYVYPPEHGKRDFPNIWSPGKDKQDSTDDDIANWTTSGEDGESATSSSE